MMIHTMSGVSKRPCLLNVPDEAIHNVSDSGWTWDCVARPQIDLYTGRVQLSQVFGVGTYLVDCANLAKPMVS